MFPQVTLPNNVLSFTLPGFEQTLHVKFPDSRLPVCAHCKKNFKTRDICRVRQKHTEAPWSTAYICLTLDDTCTDKDGNLMDKPMVCRMTQWQPYCVPVQFAKNEKTPVCAACKKTNRTRTFCRERHKHRLLPWSTVYVLMSTLESVESAATVPAPSKPADGDATSPPPPATEGESEKLPATVTDASTAAPAVGIGSSSCEGSDTIQNELTASEGQRFVDSPFGEASTVGSKTSESPSGISEDTSPGGASRRLAGQENEGGSLHPVAETRTLLVKVSIKSTTITWLELQHDTTSRVGGIGLSPQGVPGTKPAPVFARDQATMSTTELPYSFTPHSFTLATAAAAAAAGVPAHAVDPSHLHSSVHYEQQQYYYDIQQHQHQVYHLAWPCAYPSHHHPSSLGGLAPHRGSTPVGEAWSTVPLSPSRVTAGEAAAAQQEKMNRETSQTHIGPPSPDPPPPPPIPYLHHPAVATSSAAGAASPDFARTQGPQEPWRPVYGDMYQPQMSPMQMQFNPHPGGPQMLTNMGAPIQVVRDPDPGHEYLAHSSRQPIATHNQTMSSPVYPSGAVYAQCQGQTMADAFRSQRVNEVTPLTTAPATHTPRMLQETAENDCVIQQNAQQRDGENNMIKRQRRS